MKFYKRANDGIEWHEAELTDDEVATIRREHNTLSKEILQDCLTADENPFLISALFNKRCPSFMNLIENALDSKITYMILKARKLTVNKIGMMTCPKCGSMVVEYFKPGYKWWCGKCKMFKVKAVLDSNSSE